MFSTGTLKSILRRQLRKCNNRSTGALAHATSLVPQSEMQLCAAKLLTQVFGCGLQSELQVRRRVNAPPPPFHLLLNLLLACCSAWL